jgi:plasmid stabilization system protein ParE
LKARLITSADRAGEVRQGIHHGIVAFCLRLTTFPLRGNQRDDLLPGLRMIGFERRDMIAFVETDEAVLIEGIFNGGAVSGYSVTRAPQLCFLMWEGVCQQA